jgi:outer membrane protein assembly factor BamB
MSAHRKTALTFSTIGLLSGSLLAAAPGVSFANDWPSMGLDGGRGRASSERSGASFSPAWNGSASAGPIVGSPAVADGFVVVAGTKGDISVLRAIDGSEAWTVKAPGAVGASPAIDHGHVFVPTLTGQLQALRLATGTEMWKRSFGGQNYGSPAIVADGMGQSLVLAAGFPSQSLVRVSASSGITQWETAKGAVADLVNSSPALMGGQVVFGMNGGRYQSLDLLTGATTWKADAAGSVGLSAPLVVGLAAYFLPGGRATALYAANATTGELSAGWPVTITDPAAPAASAYGSSRNAVSSPALMGDLVVFTARFEYDLSNNPNGTAGAHVLREYVVAVNPATATVAWQREIGHWDVLSINDIPELNLGPTPAAFGSDTGTLLAVTSSIEAKVRVFDQAGSEAWSASLSAPTRSSPVFANGLLLIATDLGVVHAFSSDVNHAPLAPASGFDPADGQMVESKTPTLHWAQGQDVEGGALEYQVRVAADGNLLESWLVELAAKAGEPTVDVPAGLLQGGGTYTYAVRSRDAMGAWSAWSASSAFIVALTPTIAIGDKEFDSIDQAVAAVPATGGTITLGRGLLHLHAPLQLPAGVSLVGVAPHETILDATGVSAAIQISAASRTGATQVKNLTVTGAEVGVQVVDVQNATLRNIVVRDNKKAGIQVEEGAGAEAVNITLARNGAGAVVAGKLSIRSSLVVDNDTGLARTGVGMVQSRYNDVTGNKTTNYQDLAGGTGDISSSVAFRSSADFRLLGLQPSTDHGDPADDFALEPSPNGGRVNMGAFGNTADAELSGSTRGWSAITLGATAAPGVGPGPVVDGPTKAGSGSGCALGGGASRPAGTWILLAVGAMILVGRRRRA